MNTATLTLIQLNPSHPQVRRDLRDRQALHRTVMRLAPDHLGPSPRALAGLLYRLETNQEQPSLLVQTTQPPLLDRLPNRYGTTHTRSLTRLLDNLHTGQRVRYRITANPCKRLSTRNRTVQPGEGSARPGGIHALHGDDALNWWHRRSHTAGLEVEEATWQPGPSHHPPTTGPRPRHWLLQFDGTAHITDKDALTHALAHGIGKGKPYGAGLLSLAPA